MMLSPAPPPAFQPQLKSDYFFNDDPAIGQSPLQLNSPFPSSTSPPQRPHPAAAYLDDDDEDEADTISRSLASDHRHDAPSVPPSWATRPLPSHPTASHTQPLPTSLHHDSSTGSDTPSPIPQPKAVRGTPPGHPQPHPQSQSQASASTAPQSNVSSANNSPTVSSTASSAIPSPLPFRPQSGHDGAVEYVGPFILGRVLGRGCTGTVRLGTHKHTGFEVAFKIIEKKYLNSDVKLWKKVKREIAILKLIEHPHVLKLYDVLETEHRLYLVLEHVKGGELFDYIVSKGRLDRDESLRLTAQIVMGLEHCHLHSICHRDLKPENLLLDEALNIKLGDFGMAQLMKNNSILKTSCGSPHYASPEIIEGQTYDAKVTDVWSIGVILYALITGSLPFDHDNIPTLLSMVTKGHYTTPAHVPSDVSHLISRMLTVDPKKRIKLSDIRRHPCFKGTQHFAPLKATTWPYSSADSAKATDAKHRKRKSLPSLLTRDGSSDQSPVDVSSDSDGESFVDESILTDLEALGLDLNGNREELRQKIAQRATSSDQPNIERVFYRLLKKRRNSRIEQLSLLSPKISPRHFGGPPGAGQFLRAHSEPDTCQYRPLDELEGKGIAGSAPSSRVSSQYGPEVMVSPPVSGVMGEGEWVPAVPGSRSVATSVESTSSQSSTGSRVPISPLLLDDDRRPEDDYAAYGILPQRQQSAPSTTHPDYPTDLPAAGQVQRETSASAYYNRMVARTSLPAMVASMSVPPSPYVVSTNASVASAPSSPLFTASSTPPTPSQLSTSAPYPSSVMRPDGYPAVEYHSEPSPSASSHRYSSAERRSSVPTTSPVPPSYARQRASSAITSPVTPHDSVARRLFITEEKQSELDRADLTERDGYIQSRSHAHPVRSPHQRVRSMADPTLAGRSPAKPMSEAGSDFTQSPRFHRVRFNPAHAPQGPQSPTSASSLLAPAALDSPVAKRSWFSSIFSRRPSLDLFKGGKKKLLPPPSASAANSKPVSGIYSSKTTLAIADEVRRALKSAGIRYSVTKGNSNGASLFECEVGGEEEKEEKRLGLRFLTRRKSTTAIDPHAAPPHPPSDPVRFPAGRRASMGTALTQAMARTAPLDTAHMPLETGSSSPTKRTGLPIPPSVPRHAAVKARGQSPPSDDRGKGSQSAGNTPRQGLPAPVPLSSSHPPPGVSAHTRHASLKSPPPVERPAGVPPVARRRANSHDEGEGEGRSATASPVVKLIVEITSHHSNDLRCVRFLHVSGDEALYRQVQGDIQQRLTLNASQ